MITPDDKCIEWALPYIRQNRSKEIGAVLFDIGSNKGEWIQTVLNMLGGKFVVHGFEPNPGAFEILETNIKADNVVLNNYGFSSCEEETVLYVPTKKDSTSKSASALSSVYPRKIFNTWSDSNVVEQKVTLRTLDSVVEELGFEKINFLKIDVEGHELAVLKGARQLFADGKVNVGQIEVGGTLEDSGVTIKDFVEFLNEYNYGLYFGDITPLNELKEDRNFEWENLLFVNKELLL